MAQRTGPSEALFEPLTPDHSGSLTFTQAGLEVLNSDSYSYQTAKSNVGVKGGGKFYYEVQLKTNSQMLLGFITSRCAFAPDGSDAIGADRESWGYDGYNSAKYHGSSTSEEYGSRYWKNDDVLGVLLDLDSKKISYRKNNEDLGVAFTGVPTNVWIFPAISLKRYQKVLLNLGAKKFRYPQKGYLPYAKQFSAKDEGSLTKLFEHYQQIGLKLSESLEDRGDVVKSDGVFQLGTDLGATGDEDPLTMLVCWKLGCEIPWQISRKEWMDGFGLYGVCTVKAMRAAAEQWKSDTFASMDSFRPFYCYCFDYLKEDRKILTIDEAQMLWTILDLASRWKLWDSWLKFLEAAKRDHIKRDEWSLLLNMIETHPESVADYDLDGPFPSLFDDFEEYVTGGDA